MRKLDRAPAIRPANWVQVAQSAVPDAAAFQQKAQAFEALPLTDPTRRAGFTAYAPEVLPKRNGRPFFNPLWGQYKEPIAKISHDQCAYCECSLNSKRVQQVEHFKPKSLFPLSAYDWDNYLLACGGCNGPKSDKWPQNGDYLRPDDPAFDPSQHLTFDANGDVVGMTPTASQTIADFELKRKLLNDDRKLFINAIQEQLDLIVEFHALSAQRGEVLARELLHRVNDPRKTPYSTALTQFVAVSISTRLPGVPLRT